MRLSILLNCTILADGLHIASLPNLSAYAYLL